MCDSLSGNIKTDLQTTHDALKQLRSLCQCQSDDDKIAVNRQLANSEELLEKLEIKFNGIATVKMCDISVKRLPSNWRAAMLKIAREKAKKAFNDNLEHLNDNKEDKQENSNEVNNDITNNANNANNGNNGNNEDIKTDDDKGLYCFPFNIYFVFLMPLFFDWVKTLLAISLRQVSNVPKVFSNWELFKLNEKQQKVVLIYN